MRFAPEGTPFITGTAALAAVVMLFTGAAFSAPFILLCGFMCWFFRDPERAVPAEPDIFVAPADGKVIVVRDTREDRHLGRDVKQISIFMSPLNVHVNRVPCDGRIKLVRHSAGRFLAAYRDEASIQNEHIEMVYETGYGDILLRQVAGFVARRAVCRVKEGDALRRGERYGIIKFSSRVDIYLPKNVVPRVAVGDAVKAGETILAAMGL